LKPNYYRYWGKARKREDGGYDYNLLAYHCLDVAAVGVTLLRGNRWLFESTAAKCGIGLAAFERMTVILLALHDIGKFSVSFQGLRRDWFTTEFLGNQGRPYDQRHDTMGFIIWRDYVKTIVEEEDAELASMLEHLIRSGTGHHGLPPMESAQGGNRRLTADQFCCQEDLDAVRSFVHEILQLFTMHSPLPIDNRNVKQQLRFASWLVTGFGVLADWIGSNEAYFPACGGVTANGGLEEYWCKHALPGAELAATTIQWRQHALKQFKSPEALFPFISEPTPLQKFVANTELPEGPQLWIVEDVAGAGKTEAAMILTQRLMYAGNAHGLYVGLPTMATANAMYKRMQETYRRFYGEEQVPSLVLSHGHRHLMKTFTETIGIKACRADRESEGEESAQAYCNEWIADNRKKALLADVGIGTIDQVLLSILPARHQALRMLGLQGKVLLIDEVHACDPYMEHLLEALLEAHARNGGSAILLSATIPLERKCALEDAFIRGLGGRAAQDDPASIGGPGFPLVTVVAASTRTIHPVETRAEVIRTVDCRFIHSAEDVIRLITEEANRGKCVCWVRNTVADARRAYRMLAEHGNAGATTALFHSRFAMVDRARIEESAMTIFGERSTPEQRHAQVLIATQVVEQSLDLDFDIMISDLAPIDLLIQRAGRLCRHVRDSSGARRQGIEDGRGTPVLYVHAPVYDKQPSSDWLEGDFAGTAAVYRHVGRLWLTMRILRKKRGWRMPEDARLLIEAVYGERSGNAIPGALMRAQLQAIGNDQAQTAMGHLNALVLSKGYCRDAAKADQWNEETKVSTRLSAENTEIVLVVPEKDYLVPYADVFNNAWDWSALSVSRNAWRRSKYQTPEEYLSAVERLKQSEPRLKHSEIVVVNARSTAALAEGKPVSDYYHPLFGWGNSREEE
jgi:CRISPR-associated endonuclease/helicase Cas3